MNRAKMRRVTRRVAKNNNVSVAEVKREMQIAVKATYANPNAAAMAIPRKGAMPTTREFIGHVIEEVRAEK